MTSKEKIIIILVFLASFVLRIVLLPYKTHWSDMLFWKSWGNDIATNGVAGFYQRVNSDYLPFYPLILGVVKKTYDFFSPSFPIDYAYKTPAIIFDLLTGWLIWLFLKKQGFWPRVFFLSLFLFNPITFFTSAMWGQVDVIGTFFILGSFYLLFQRKKVILSAIFLGLSLLTKPIFLLGLPIAGMVFLNKWLGGQKIGKFASLFFLTTLATVWLVTINFIPLDQKINLKSLIVKPFLLISQQVIKNGQWYPYTTINAFNFWYLVDGRFWLTDQRIFFGLNLNQWGIFLLAFTAFLVFLKTVYSGQNGKKSYSFYLFTFCILSYATFLFLTRIHERHLFYTLPFLLLLSVKTKRLLVGFLVLSLTYTLNLYFALENFLSSGRYTFSPLLMFSLSFTNLLIFFWIFLEYIFWDKKLKNDL